MDINKLYMNVSCISVRNSLENQVSVGNSYILDRSTIWIDSDGDVYGVIYTPDMKRVGQMLLKHFKTI